MKKDQKGIVEFEFDPEKNESNFKAHGISFEEATELWLGTHVIIPAKQVSGESRQAIVGKILGKLYVGIFASRGDKIRIISCHRADRRWERFYDKTEGEK